MSSPRTFIIFFLNFTIVYVTYFTWFHVQVFLKSKFLNFCYKKNNGLKVIKYNCYNFTFHLHSFFCIFCFVPPNIVETSKKYFDKTSSLFINHFRFYSKAMAKIREKRIIFLQLNKLRGAIIAILSQWRSKHLQCMFLEHIYVSLFHFR